MECILKTIRRHTDTECLLARKENLKLQECSSSSQLCIQGESANILRDESGKKTILSGATEYELYLAENTHISQDYVYAN